MAGNHPFQVNRVQVGLVVVLLLLGCCRRFQVRDRLSEKEMHSFSDVNEFSMVFLLDMGSNSRFPWFRFRFAR
jgi:hypothetical protein